MSDPDDGAAASPLANAPATAVMSSWMTVEAFGDECLFGFATSHPTTGGLSWILSTPVIEFTASADKARTASGRVYALDRHVTHRELDEEGRVALRLLLLDDPDGYPGRSDDLAWVTSRKMARHLAVTAPSRVDPIAVEHFIRSHINAYLALRIGRRGDQG
jgi:hypothetical protein